MKIAGLDLSITSSGIVIMELDDDYNIINIERHGFCDTLKQLQKSPDMIYYNLKDFRNKYERYQFFCDYIFDWVKDCEYISVEQYAFDAKGYVFDLAEFEGNIKISLFRNNKTMRFYPPMSNKKFFTEIGNCGKIRMYETYLKYSGKKFDISDLPIVVDDKHGAKPTSDLIDAYALCEYLRYELMLRNKKIKLNELSKKQQECFKPILKMDWDILKKD